MHISQLRPYKFRNLEDTSIDFIGSRVLVLGSNGNGKTNLIEAIHVLGSGRSFRTSTTAEFITIGEKEGSVFGLVKGHHGENELGIIFEKEGKSAFINGNKVANLSDFLGHLVTVTFTPSDLVLVKGSPAFRRKFLDRHLVDIQPRLFKEMVIYQRALKSKNSLLKSSNVREEDLLPWNHILAQSGANIVRERKNFVNKLEEKASEIHKNFAEFDGELSIYLNSSWLKEGEESIKEKLLEDLNKAAQREIVAKSSKVGPHRDDIVIKLNGIDSKSFASQGQTRSIVLSLKLAVILMIEEVMGEPPIVLLDDIDSELDAERSKKLFSFILEREGQIFVTGTSSPPLVNRGFDQVITVDQGVVRTSL